MKPMMTKRIQNKEVEINTGEVILNGNLAIPEEAYGIVLFAHGSGSSRHSPRNNYVAEVIQRAGLATLLFDLLTEEEEAVDLTTRELRFDIGLLARRLLGATAWLAASDETKDLTVGYFGSSTGGAAALIAAGKAKHRVGAVVSRGGRPDLAGDALPQVESPVLLLVGGLDTTVIRLNEVAMASLTCDKELRIVAGATHLFEEPGTLQKVAEDAAEFFAEKLGTVEG